jgi:hypothetical protein
MKTDCAVVYHIKTDASELIVVPRVSFHDNKLFELGLKPLTPGKVRVSSDLWGNIANQTKEQCHTWVVGDQNPGITEIIESMRSMDMSITKDWARESYSASDGFHSQRQWQYHDQAGEISGIIKSEYLDFVDAIPPPEHHGVYSQNPAPRMRKKRKGKEPQTFYSSRTRKPRVGGFRQAHGPAPKYRKSTTSTYTDMSSLSSLSSSSSSSPPISPSLEHHEGHASPIPPPTQSGATSAKDNNMMSHTNTETIVCSEYELPRVVDPGKESEEYDEEEIEELERKPVAMERKPEEIEVVQTLPHTTSSSVRKDSVPELSNLHRRRTFTSDTGEGTSVSNNERKARSAPSPAPRHDRVGNPTGHNVYPHTKSPQLQIEWVPTEEPEIVAESTTIRPRVTSADTPEHQARPPAPPLPPSPLPERTGNTASPPHSPVIVVPQMPEPEDSQRPRITEFSSRVNHDYRATSHQSNSGAFYASRPQSTERRPSAMRSGSYTRPASPLVRQSSSRLSRRSSTSGAVVVSHRHFTYDDEVPTSLPVAHIRPDPGNPTVLPRHLDSDRYRPKLSDIGDVYRLQPEKLRPRHRQVPTDTIFLSILLKDPTTPRDSSAVQLWRVELREEGSDDMHLSLKLNSTYYGIRGWYRRYTFKGITDVKTVQVSAERPCKHFSIIIHMTQPVLIHADATILIL